MKEILLIDESKFYWIKINIFLKNRGYNIIHKRSYLDGLYSAKKNKPDLIILDINNPKINGYKLFKNIRKFTNVPFIFIASDQQIKENLIHFIEFRDNWIQKIFTPEKLLKLIVSSLRVYKSKNNKLSKVNFFSYSENSIRVLILALEEARAKNKDFVGIKEFLIGLKRLENKIKFEVKLKLNFFNEEDRDPIEKFKTEYNFQNKEIYFSDKLRIVLENAHFEFINSREKELNLEHLLLGLVNSDIKEITFKFNKNRITKINLYKILKRKKFINKISKLLKFK